MTRLGRNIARHGQQRNQLIRAVAQHDLEPLRHPGMFGQGASQVVHPTIGVTVQRCGPQPAPQLLLQSGGQTVRILHGIELDHARRFLNGIGMHGLHVLSDTAGDQ